MQDTQYSDLKLLNIRKSAKIYTIDEIKAMSYPIFKKYKIKKAFIFGSYSQGTARRSSDIDFMVEGGNIKSLGNLTEFALELVQLFRKEVDIICEENYKNDKSSNEYFKRANKLFYDRVCKERVLIYE